jgi:hypothetical protein
VPDQHGRLVELADQPLVVLDDLRQAEPGEIAGVPTELVDVTVLARPLGSRHGEAALAEVVGEVLPAACREPGAVDEHQRDPVGIGAGSCHGLSPSD